MSDLIEFLPGFGRRLRARIVERFELTFFRKNPKQHLIDYQVTKFKVITAPLNIILSQISTVNNQRGDLHKLNVIRLYLIKAYKGRCHALGKPVRGQRTWSNSWNSYNTNKVLRSYITEINNQLKSKLKVEKINYKVIKKKYAAKNKNKKKSPLVKKKLL